MNLVISTSYPQVQIDINWPDARISQRVGYFNSNYTGPKMTIDQRAAWIELGMGDLRNFVEENAAAAKYIVYNHIGRVASEGDRLADEIMNRDTIANIAKEKIYAEIPEINVDIKPRTPPRITSNYDLDLQWISGEAELEIFVRPPKIDWVMGVIDISYVKGNKIDIKG